MPQERMSLERSVFFERATGHLLSTLNLEEGLGRLRAYMSEVMPLRSIRMLGYPIRTQGMTKVLIMRINESEGKNLIFLADEPHTQGLLPELLRENREGGELITEPSHPLVSWIYEMEPPARFPIASLPWYVLALWDEDCLIGECRFCGDSEHPFLPEHCELMNSLRSVLCIALNNYRQYIQVREGRDAVLRENTRLREALADDGAASAVIGAQGGLRMVLERVRMVAPYDVPVLITGETGTGKELIARQLHALSPRRDQSFIAVNCGAIPSSLSDSELFGHVKGSFTGAIRDHKGYFERADGGTLFLDEIGELPLDTQVRLLRVLQESMVLPVGGTTPVAVNTRIVAATNRDLQAMMSTGTFRKDLYYRLRVAHILLPPLRERPGDIPALVQHFLHKIVLPEGFSVPRLAPEELIRMQRYPWPGNVRELENTLLEAVVCTPAGEPLRLHLDNAPAPASLLPPVEPVLRSDDVMAEHYRAVLERCRGRIKGPYGVAVLLGVHPSTLRFRLKKLGVLPSEGKTSSG